MSKLDIERAFPPDPEIAAEAPAAPEVPAAGVAVKPPRNANWRSANVLAGIGTTRRLWRFKVNRESVGAPEEVRILPGKALPESVVGKGWNALLSPAMNIAWLPADEVFLRILQVPAGPLEEVVGLVELQMDKLSTLPPSHVVWSVEILPHPDPNQQTVLVVIVPRARVDEHLTALEEAGFVPDRLAVPFAGRLRDLPPGDGLWMIAEDGGTVFNFLLAWRLNGVWREVSVVNLARSPGVVPALNTHLTRMGWAAELAGWMPVIPEVHLVAPASLRGELEAALSGWSGDSVRCHEPAPVEAQAAAGAMAQLRGQSASVLPAETQARHRQQFVDRLWIQGLGAVLMAYLVGVVVYLGWLNWRKWELENLQVDNRGLALQYTNTLAIKAQKEILEEQVALRYAALDSWKLAIEKLPPGLNLSTINFSKGRTFRLDGTVSSDAQPEVVNFGNELRKLTLINGLVQFSTVKPGPITVRGNLANWSIEAELNRSEVP